MNRRSLSKVLFVLALIGPVLVSAPYALADDDQHGQSRSGDSRDDHSDDETEIDDDHDIAREAVKANQAIPLGDMLDMFDERGHLTVVDIALVTRSGRLQYRIKYIDPAGRVRQQFFNAKTGALEL